MTKLMAAVMVRGRTGIRSEIKDTLRMLRLTRVNHCVLVDDRPTYVGMLKKCKDRITWGEIDENTLALLLERKAERAEKAKFNPKDAAARIISSKSGLEEEGVKPVFRLHAPRGGYEDTKKAFPAGSLGYMGGEINALIRKMI